MSEQHVGARIEQLESEISTLKELLGNCIYIIDRQNEALQGSPFSGGMAFEPSGLTMVHLKQKAKEAGVEVKAIH